MPINKYKIFARRKTMLIISTPYGNLRDTDADKASNEKQMSFEALCKHLVMDNQTGDFQVILKRARKRRTPEMKLDLSKTGINIKQLGKGWSAERYGFASWKYVHKTGAYLVRVGGFSDEWELDSWESWLLVRSGHLSIRVNSSQEANRLVQELCNKKDSAPQT